MLVIHKSIFKAKFSFALIIAAIFCQLLLAACSPNSSKNGLQGSNYFMSDSDSSHVYLSKRKDSIHQIVIDEQIVDFRESPGYLFVLRKEAKSYQCGEGDKRTIITNYSDKSTYWIIDLKNELEFHTDVYGLFLDKAKSLNLTLPALDYSKKYFVNDQSFDVKLYACVPIS